ncbi:hypothetical protein [Lysinibacillus sp. RC79]|uniref:hypothetical protein n=1 Tax=Lysinibacillus sp. RC79 TaxID=3156296 RepID=UPI003510DCA0
MEVTQEQKSLFTKIGYLYLQANNIDEAIEWYQNKLGFHQFPGGRSGHGFINFRPGACKSGIPWIYRVYWRANSISRAGGVAANFISNFVGFGRIP